MKLNKHRNHRDLNYLNWLRTQACAVSEIASKAQCTHHVRLATNGGSGIKPSDYFCIPLLNEFHTTGSSALHIIGEETFFIRFKINPNQLFIKYLKAYLVEKFQTYVELEAKAKAKANDDLDEESLIALMIDIIQSNGPKFPKKAKKKKTKRSTVASKSKVSITQNEYYQQAKAAKKIKDKELRQQMKNAEDNSFKDKVRETQRAYAKEMRDKNKERMSKYRKEQYQKLKELRS